MDTFNVLSHTAVPAFSRASFKAQILAPKKLIGVRVVEAMEHISLLHSDTEVPTISTNLSTLQTSVRRLPCIFFLQVFISRFCILLDVTLVHL